MRKRIRRYLNRRYCRQHGHGVACEIEVFNLTGFGTLYEHHTHTCPKCGTVTLDETQPLSNPVRGILADMGLPIEQQRSALLN